MGATATSPERMMVYKWRGVGYLRHLSTGRLRGEGGGRLVAVGSPWAQSQECYINTEREAG